MVPTCSIISYQALPVWFVKEIDQAGGSHARQGCGDGVARGIHRAHAGLQQVTDLQHEGVHRLEGHL